MTVRVIATLLVDPARGVIKGRQFQHDRVVGEPIQWARVMAQLREVDELVVFDVTHGPPDLPLIERIAAECFVPLAYGGGIHDASTAVQIVKRGVDKVVLKDRSLMTKLAMLLGSQSVVACLDLAPSHINTYVHGLWTSPGPYAIQCVQAGAGEILLQSVARDGTLEGYDLESLDAVRKSVDVPLIASSGAGSELDCVAAVTIGADAVAAGAMYQFLEITPNMVKTALAEAGYPVRLMKVPA